MMLQRRSLFELLAATGLVGAATHTAAQAQPQREAQLPVALDPIDKPIARGPRDVPYLDIYAADWATNEFGVDALMLSQDEVSGAFSVLLRMPPDLDYPEEAHFYDCEVELFQVEGNYYHDVGNPYLPGDYIYRPPGTMYGHSNGTDGGGLIFTCLNRQGQRFHSQDHDTDRGPWDGEYLVDALWNPRPVSFMKVKSVGMDWQPSGLHPHIMVKPLRGEPGQNHPYFGATQHSPWGPDAAFVLKLNAGFEGKLPLWTDNLYEVFALEGQGTINDQPWQKGVYHFGRFVGDARIERDLICYVRSFADLQA